MWPVSYGSCGHSDTYNTFWGEDQPQTMDKGIIWEAQVCLGLENVVLDKSFGCWSGWELSACSLRGLGILTLPFYLYNLEILASSFVSDMCFFVCVCMHMCTVLVYESTCVCSSAYIHMYCILVEWRIQPQVVELSRHFPSPGFWDNVSCWNPHITDSARVAH